MCKPSPKPDTVAPAFFLIGELAEQTGLGPSAIRFYEREGLIEPRRHGRFRVYLAADIHRLEGIIKPRAMGLSVEVIRRLVGDRLEDHAVKAALEANRCDLVRQQAEVERQLNELAATLGDAAG